MVNNNIYKLSLFLNKLEIRYLNFFHHFLCFSATFTQKGRIEQFVSVRGYSNSEATGLLRNDFWSNKFFRSSKSSRTTLKALLQLFSVLLFESPLAFVTARCAWLCGKLAISWVIWTERSIVIFEEREKKGSILFVMEGTHWRKKLNLTIYSLEIYVTDSNSDDALNILLKFHQH